MKQLFKVIIYGSIDLIFKHRFKRSLKNIDQKDVVYLVDIDNTLADTWPSLKNYVYRNEKHRYASLSIFIGMRNFVLDKMRAEKKVVFISARSYFDYCSTIKWLSGNGLESNIVILVNKAEGKLDYVKILLNRGISVVYVDDMSYGHEHGEVKYYEKMILKLNELPIEYLGIKEIELINSTYETSN